MLFVKKSAHRNHRGMVLVIAMIFLVIFSALAVSLATISGANAQIAGNQHKAGTAFLAAQSGLEVVRYYLSQVSLGNSVQPADRLQGVSTYLANAGFANTYDTAAKTITIPNLVVNSQINQQFSAQISFGSDFNNVNVDIFGKSHELNRQIRSAFSFTKTGSGIFDYGIATKGPLSLTGNARIEGVHNAGEANVYIESNEHNEALGMTGNVSIQGDVEVVNPLAYASLSGNCSIAGQTGDAAHDHVTFGAEAVDFPEPDISIFEPYATNVITSSISTHGNKTFQNIRIAANSNPTFSGNITINGVIYIESPNHVTFQGNTIITGIVVAEGNLESPDSADQIEFKGNLTSQSVANLPAGSAYDGLRDKTGTFILAPGFGLSFAGNFNTVNGAIAASGVNFTGNAGGIITNSVINYSEDVMTLAGNSHLQFDRSNSESSPAGFSQMQTLQFQTGSYAEIF